MSRRILAFTLGLSVFAAPVVFAEGDAADPNAAPAPKAAPLPEVVADDVADAALAAFKENWKAKDLQGDDRLAQRDCAMQQLTLINHPKVVDELAKVLRGNDPNLRIAAAVHLSTQKALPVAAGKRLAEAVQRNKNDVAFVMACLSSVGQLKYLGASDLLEELLKHPDFSIRKAAIDAIGATQDARLLLAMLKIVRIDPEKGAPPEPKKSSGQTEQDGEGYSWEGAEATVDTGTAGDGDQKAAEAKAKAEAAKNKADAERAAGASGGTSGGGKPAKPGGRGGGGGGRSIQELIHPIQRALTAITGQEFDTPQAVYTWLVANRGAVADLGKEVGVAEKQQAKDEKELLSASK